MEWKWNKEPAPRTTGSQRTKATTIDTRPSPKHPEGQDPNRFRVPAAWHCLRGESKCPQKGYADAFLEVIASEAARATSSEPLLRSTRHSPPHLSFKPRFIPYAAYSPINIITSSILVFSKSEKDDFLSSVESWTPFLSLAPLLSCCFLALSIYQAKPSR